MTRAVDDRTPVVHLDIIEQTGVATEHGIGAAIDQLMSDCFQLIRRFTVSINLPIDRDENDIGVAFGIGNLPVEGSLPQFGVVERQIEVTGTVIGRGK